MTIQRLEYRAAAHVNGRPVFDHRTVDNPARAQLAVNVSRRATLARLLTGRRVTVEFYLDGNRAARHFHDNDAATRIAMHFLDAWPNPRPRPIAHYTLDQDGTLTDNRTGALVHVKPNGWDGPNGARLYRGARARIASWLNRFAEHRFPWDGWEHVPFDRPDETDVPAACHRPEPEPARPEPLIMHTTVSDDGRITRHVPYYDPDREGNAR